MATIYFTSTAATGDGTLRAAIYGASEGDVVQPDPETFAVGDTVDVMLANSISPPVALCLDGNGRNLIVRHALPVNAKASDGCESLRCHDVTFAGRVICGGSANAPMTASFERCAFGSHANTNTPIFQSASGYATISFESCLFAGSLTHAIYLSGVNTETTFNHCTIAANVGVGLYGNAISSAVITDSIIDPDLSTAGFINAPASMSGYSDENLPPWETWNFRPLPSSPYATGAASSNGYDLDGNLRGRDVDGETIYALGAYEAINADYYLADATAERFDDLGTWSTTRGGTDTPTEITAGTFYIDKNVSLLGDAPEGSVVVVAGKTTAELEASNLASLVVGRCANVLGGATNALTLSFGASYSGLHDATIKELTLRECATYPVEADVHYSTLTMELGSALFLGGERRVVIVDEASFGAAVVVEAEDGESGYLVVPIGADTTTVTTANVVVCNGGAHVSRLSGYATDRRAIFKWERENPIAICVEYRVGDDGAWTLVDPFYDDVKYVLESPGGATTLRVFDGEVFSICEAISVSCHNELRADVDIGYTLVETSIGYIQ